MSFNFSPKIVTDGLVLYLDAANNKSYASGSTIWNDLSKTSSVGTLTNGPTYNSSNGGSIVFDGVDDYINLGDLYNLNYNSATLGAWIKTTSSQIYPNIIGKPYYGGKIGRYSLYVLPDGALGLITSQTDSINIDVNTTTGLINTGRWTYIVGVIDRNLGNVIYVNGTIVGSASGDTSAYDWNTTDNFTLGLYTSAPNGYFNGSISNGFMYNRALTSTEVLQNYNATKGRFGL